MATCLNGLIIPIDQYNFEFGQYDKRIKLFNGKSFTSVAPINGSIPFQILEPIDRGNSRTKPAESKGKVSKGKYKKDGDDDDEDEEVKKVDRVKENKKKSKPTTKPTDAMPKEHKTDSKETKSQSAKSKTLPDNAKKVREGSSEEGTSGHKQCKLIFK